MSNSLYFMFRIAQKRGDAVSREVMGKVADDKKMTKQEKDERCVESVQKIKNFLPHSP